MSDHEEIIDPLARAVPTVKIKNVTNQTLRVWLHDQENTATLDDKRQPLVELDPNRPANEDGRPQPKLYGPKKTVRQLRSREIVLPPKKTVVLPWHLLFTVLRVRCAICAEAARTLDGVADQRGRCTRPEDPEHTSTWTIDGGALLSPEQVEVSGLAHALPPSTTLVEELAEHAKSDKTSGYGRRFHEVKRDG